MIGPPGFDGDQGQRGPQGDPGVQGVTGDKGEQGQKGPQGPVGEQGDDGGPKGEQGAPGQQGEPGNKGTQGDPGNKGVQGQQGDPGATGPVGDPGPDGDPGVQGQQGVKGQQGLPGMAAVQGEQGPPGEQGEQGDPGVQGQQGQQGAVGNQGVQGAVGAQGEPGTDSGGGTIQIKSISSPNDLYDVNSSVAGYDNPERIIRFTISGQTQQYLLMYLSVTVEVNSTNTVEWDPSVEPLPIFFNFQFSPPIGLATSYGARTVSQAGGQAGYVAVVNQVFYTNLMGLAPVTVTLTISNGFTGVSNPGRTSWTNAYSEHISLTYIYM